MVNASADKYRPEPADRFATTKLSGPSLPGSAKKTFSTVPSQSRMTPNLTSLGPRHVWLGAPQAVADFDAGGDVDDEREATVVAQEPRLAADADEAIDLRRVWINGHQGSGHGAEFTQDIAIETPPGNILGLEGAAEEVAVSRVRLYRFADDELDPKEVSSFCFGRLMT